MNINTVNKKEKNKMDPVSIALAISAFIAAHAAVVGTAGAVGVGYIAAKKGPDLVDKAKALVGK